MNPLDVTPLDGPAECWPGHGFVDPSAPAGLLARTLNEADFDALIAMRQQVAAELADEDCYVLEPGHFVRAHLGKHGETIGLFACGRLIAYAMLGSPQDDGPGRPMAPDPMADALRLPPTERGAVAHLASSMVLPEWRGGGLHKWLIRHRLARCAALGRRRVMAMVSPRNIASWHNLIQCGLVVRAIEPLEGDRLRYLLYRDLHRKEADGPQLTEYASPADLNRQRALLAAGYRGVGMTRAGGDARLLYRKAATLVL